MGIGALRRYHPTLDEKIADEAGVEVGDRFNEEGNKNLDGVTTSADAGQAAQSNVQSDPGSITQPPSAADAAALTGDLTDEQREQLSGDAGKSNDDLTADEQAKLVAAASTVEQPPRTGAGSSLEAWQAFARANGKTDSELDGLGRDEIAALFGK